ncbi:MAG: CehA/McbA family metallohydrolase [Bacteroidales bacterium]|nr:CehA/McbA family metallohydrolase [Bacteroidales bacterium]
MMKRQTNFLIGNLLVLIMGVVIPLKISAQTAELKLQIDGATKYQTMDGFGVNINPAWWYNGSYTDAKIVQPAIDLLVDSLGATIFRAVIEEIDWEEVNDDNDPDHFNWDYYNKVFSSPRFMGVWNTLRYLNQKGITDGLVISFMGAGPAAPPLEKPDPKRSWMGGIGYSIEESMEEELVESQAAFLYYMRNTEKIKFSLVSPMNETDIIGMTISDDHPLGLVEGPNISDAVQYVRVVRKLAKKLDNIGMNDIRFVAPDAGGDKLFYAVLDEMVKDQYLMDKLFSWGVHQYGSDSRNYMNKVKMSSYPTKPYWVTETARISHLLGQLDDNATSYIFWDGFDCIYQHGRRNGYGSVPPNDWVFWFGPKDGTPLVELIPATGKWKPRKQFYEYAQVMKFVRPGAVRLGITGQDSTLSAFAFCNPDGKMVILGRNNSLKTITFNGNFTNLPVLKNMKLIYTDSIVNFIEGKEIIVSGGSFKASIPAASVFTMTGTLSSSLKAEKPEPSGWYPGDIHIHRNCGDGTSVLSESEFTRMMEPNDLAVISVLADMGDGEVKDSKTDLTKVNGTDAIQSRPGRLVHWDAEWHFDPYGTTFENKALGGHLVFLGLKEAHTIWDESPYKILEWGKSQNAVVGFCHMQYLNDKIHNDLDCCIPIDYPVEAALGTIDFLSEDVWLNDASVNAYYKLLNCGFRLGWAAGTDFPCNNSRPFGSLLTYVQVKDQPMTYRKWVEGIKNGRTVVTSNGHVEFLDLKINGTSGPGDEINLKGKKSININVDWTSIKSLTGRIEIVCNGKVVAKHEGTASQGKPVQMKTSLTISESSWVCARRMDETGHQSHTAPVYITVKGEPVRASVEDAQYFVKWIENIITNIKPNGPWNQYFTHDLNKVQERYQQAQAVYEKIALEASKGTAE